MSNNFKGGSFAGKGYYIALILCAAAIGITGYLYARNANEPAPAAAQETVSEEVFLDVTDEEDVPVIATAPRGTNPVTTETVPPTTAAPKEPLKTMSPVEAEPVFSYSMEELSYNQTTRDWRVHNGIDLPAEADTPVCAAADGEVFSVSEDAAYGHTVVIRHADGYTTCYASLSDDIPVTAGQQVTMGQTVGYPSDSAIVESSMGSHVHFSVTHMGKAMDPMEFLALGQ